MAYPLDPQSIVVADLLCPWDLLNFAEGIVVFNVSGQGAAI